MAVRVSRSARDSTRRLNAAGLGLVIATGSWTIVAWLGAGGEPWGILGLVAAISAAVVAGRMTARLITWGPAASIVAVGAGFVLGWGSRTWSPSSWEGSLGYANARAAFFVVVALAALQLAVAVGRLSPIGVGLAIVAGTVPVAVRSKSASVLLVVAVVVFLVGLGEARRRFAVTVAGGIAGMVLVGTLIAGATHGPSALAGDVLEERLSTRRLTLWHESLQLIEEHPLIGVGPGRFRAVSPTARRDPDARWAHHGFLQLGVETGLPGMILALGIVVWGFVALRRTSGSLSASAAAALMAVTAHACVDYVLHSPAVPIAAALLVGAGSAASPRKPDARTERQETSP